MAESEQTIDRRKDKHRRILTGHYNKKLASVAL